MALGSSVDDARCPVLLRIATCHGVPLARSKMLGSNVRPPLGNIQVSRCEVPGPVSDALGHTVV